MCPVHSVNHVPGPYLEYPSPSGLGSRLAGGPPGLDSVVGSSRFSLSLRVAQVEQKLWPMQELEHVCNIPLTL